MSTTPVNGTTPSQDDLRKQEEAARERERNGGTQPEPQQERPLNETNISVNPAWQSGAPDYVPVTGDGQLHPIEAAIQDIVADMLDQGQVPFASPFHIDLQTLRGAESSILDALNHLVAQYDFLKAEVNTVIGQGVDFFGGQANVTRMEQPPPIPGAVAGADAPGGPMAARPVTGPDMRTRRSAEFFTPIVHEDMKSALNAIANLIAMLGGFVKMLQDAGRAYASADHASRIETT